MSEASGDFDIDDLNATGVLDDGTPTETNHVTPVGGVRLVVAGNVVNLDQGQLQRH